MILILDVEFIAKDGERASVVAVDSLDLPTGIDLSPWMAASSGILDDTDIAEIGAAMEPGSVAVVVVYENLWVIGLIDKWRQEGARLIADSGLPVEDVVAALDAAESR